jgi:exodeoxyribonuclease V alpha subunit
VKQDPELPFIDPKAATVEGTLEKIVFTNEDTGWSVVRVSSPGRFEPITAVGNLLGIQPGENLRLTGEWVRDARFGEQLAVKSYVTVKPSTLVGIERYLASGLVPGIGPTMAKRLVAHFGIDTLEIIENAGHRLKEVDGIGPIRAGRILEAWAEQRDIKDVMVFLQSHGVSSAYAIRIYKRYGRSAVHVVRENPYQLAIDVFGIGFLTADKIAGSLGIEKTSPARARAGVLHALGELVEDGHVFAPKPLLLEKARLLLEVDEAIIARAIDELAAEEAVAIEDLGASTIAIYRRDLLEAEERAAKRLIRLATAPEAKLDLDVDRALAWFESQNAITLAPEQRAALASSLRAKVSVITGGPGTGKTTIVKGLLRILEKKNRRIALAAPTGRAAKRMQEATGREARTLHRLLELDPKSGGFTRNEESPLDLDVLVVDEVSMVDLLLFDRLLAALPPSAQLVLVGDVDQLPSVGPGSVLADVISSNTVQTTKLDRIFRQAEQSLIITNAHRINRGEMPRLEKSATPENVDFYMIERRDPDDVLATIKELIQNRIPSRFGVDPIDDVQVLTPMNKGSLGVASMNRELQALLNPRGETLTRGSRVFRTGDKVMQLRNNYDLGVFNGDIGRVKSVDLEDHAVTIRFDDRDVVYGPAELDELNLAYACSIHKSQGSEFPVVVIPLSTQHWVMLQRNLLYTAVTRGRRLVVIVGSSKALSAAVNSQSENARHSHLASRLAGASAVARGL